MTQFPTFAVRQYPLPTSGEARAIRHGGEAAHHPRAASLLTFSCCFHATLNSAGAQHDHA